uniref:RAP domain-containing protein n=2 Tax=Leptobrachium leishanense TaxID=445787 RepID=A0A8C5MV20_9ANUR
MNKKVCSFALCLIRHLQSCNSLVGSQILQTTRNSRSRSAYLGLNPAFTGRVPCAHGQHADSFRFLSSKTPLSHRDGDLKSVTEESPLSVPNILDNGAQDPFEDDAHRTYLDPTEEASRNEKTWNRHRLREFSILCDTKRLHTISSPSDVLDLCGSDSLSVQHIKNSFTAMWLIFKRMKDHRVKINYEKQLMIEHQYFENLCHQAILSTHKMSPSELAYILLYVVRLQLPQSTMLVQTLLTFCQKHLHDFNVSEICVLCIALEGVESCDNVDSLRRKLRKQVEFRLPEIQKVLHLQVLMNFVGQDAPLSLKEELVKKALAMKDQFSLPNTHYMISSLAAINMSSLPLLTFCKRKLIDSIHSVPFWKMVRVLNACYRLSYQDEELLTAIGDYFFHTLYMWQTKRVSLLLHLMGNLGFRHVPLLDAFAEKIIANPQALNLKDLEFIANVYSVLNHLPEGRSQQFLDALNSSLELYLPHIAPSNLLSILYSFCVLGFFPSVPLEKLMNADVLNELLTLGKPNVEMNTWKLNKIKLCLHLEKKSPNMPGNADSIDLVTLPEASVSSPPDVETALKILVEDPTHLQKGIQLFKRYYLDFLLNVDGEQKKIVPLTYTPVAHNNSQTKRVAVLCCKASYFALGSLHVLGEQAMKIRHLKALGYHVVLVPLHKFSILDVPERVSFLKNQIFFNGSSSTEEQE